MCSLSDSSVVGLGKVAYQAYGDSVGWVNHIGLAMPTWDDLPEVIRSAWVDAALAVQGVLVER